jgi:hypothetical protein
MSNESDPIDLRAQARATNEQELEAQAQAKREAGDVKWLMSTEQGRRIAWRILSWTRLHRTPFSADRGVTDFNCGQANIGLLLQGEILTHAPGAYVTMIEESKPNE